MWNYLVYLAAMVSGLLLAMCFPGFEVEAGLVWFWPIPLMAGLWLGGGESKRKRFGFRVAWLAGLSFWLVNVKWLIAMGELPTVPVAGALVAWVLLSVYLALYFGVWGMFVATLGNPWCAAAEREMTAIERKMAQREEAPKKRRINGVRASMRVIYFSVMHASLWVVLEYLRGWVMTGFGWNGLGVAFHEQPVMMQVADIVGVSGVAFFPMFLASVMLQTGKRLLDEVRAGKFQAHLEIGIAVGVIAAVFAYGVNRMAYHANQQTRDLSVLLVQENTAQSVKWDEALEVQHTQGYLDSTQQALAALEEKNALEMQRAIETNSGAEISLEYPDFVIYPESIFTQPLVFVEGEEGVILNPLANDFLRANLLAEEHFHVIFGSNMMEGIEREEGYYFHPEGRSYNAFAVAEPRLATDEDTLKKSVQARGKCHLVPFGEYIPEWQPIPAIMEACSGSPTGMNFSASESREPLKVQIKGESLDLIPAVCFEDTVGRLLREFVRDDQQMIVNITNDGWFGTSEAAEQHVANAKFRAVELRRPLVRAANTGVTGVVDVIGSMQDAEQPKSIPPHQRATLFTTVKVPAQATMTLYALFGDWFSAVCALLAVCMGGLLWMKQRG